MPPRDPRPPDRVGAAVREEVAAFLATGAKDPRIIGFVTVTAVEMTRDLRHAAVFVSIMGTDEERAATLEGLRSTASHLRSRVGKALRLQFAPEISFKLDESVARAARIEHLLAGLKEPPAPDGDPSDG
jgi:ribosome-binding factor A